MKNALILLTSTTLFFAACKSNETGNAKDVSPDQVHRKYEVNIDEASSTATASAVFRFAGDNGTTLSLTSPAKITANETELKEGKLLFGGAYYHNEAPVSCPDNKVVLTYTDSKGEVLTEEYEAGTAAFKDNPDTFYLGKTVSLFFEGAGADNFEVQIRDKENRILNFYAVSNSEKRFEIPGTATDTLAQGELELQITANKTKELDNHSTLGGTAYYSCSYKPVKVIAVKQKAS